MARSNGRAYVFLRWSSSASFVGRLGDIGWAFEYNDRLGRFNCFYCGATEPAAPLLGRPRIFWYEKCQTLPELIKAMSNQGPERPGYDEVKVFELAEVDPETALQAVTKRSTMPDDLAATRDLLEETREILTRYGVRGLANPRGFSAPFLWYNMLPGRSVPLRKLAVHLFQLRVESDNRVPLSLTEIDEHARRIAQSDPEVAGLGECFVGRVGSAYVVCLSLEVNPKLSVAEGHAITERLEQAIRSGSPKVRHVYLRLEPHEELDT
jgi:hypothetical protein